MIYSSAEIAGNPIVNFMIGNYGKLYHWNGNKLSIDLGNNSNINLSLLI